MVTERTSFQTAQPTQVISSIQNIMEKGSKPFQKLVNTQVIGFTTTKMVKENMNGYLVKCIKVIGNGIKCMGLGFGYRRRKETLIFIRVGLLMGRNGGLVSIGGGMGRFIRAIGRMIKSIYLYI